MRYHFLISLGLLVILACDVSTAPVAFPGAPYVPTIPPVTSKYAPGSFRGAMVGAGSALKYKAASRVPSMFSSTKSAAPPTPPSASWFSSKPVPPSAPVAPTGNVFQQWGNNIVTARQNFGKSLSASGEQSLVNSVHTAAPLAKLAGTPQLTQKAVMERIKADGWQQGLKDTGTAVVSAVQFGYGVAATRVGGLLQSNNMVQDIGTGVKNGGQMAVKAVQNAWNPAPPPAPRGLKGFLSGSVAPKTPPTTPPQSPSGRWFSRT